LIQDTLEQTIWWLREYRLVLGWHKYRAISQVYAE